MGLEGGSGKERKEKEKKKRRRGAEESQQRVSSPPPPPLSSRKLEFRLEVRTYSLHNLLRKSLINLHVILPIRRLILPNRRVMKRRPKDLLTEHVV